MDDLFAALLDGLAWAVGDAIGDALCRRFPRTCLVVGVVLILLCALVLVASCAAGS